MPSSKQQKANKKHEINILISLQPMLFFVQMAGLVPWFQRNPSNLNSSIIPPRSWQNNLSNATRILQYLLTVGKFYLLFSDIAVHDVEASDIGSEDSTVNNILDSFLYGILIFNCGSRGSQFIKIINMLYNVDKELKERYYFTPRSFVDFNVKILVWLMAGFCYIFTTIFLLQTQWTIRVLLIINTSFGILAFNLLVLLCVFMRILALRFAFINKILKSYAVNQHLELLGSEKHTSFVTIRGNYDDIKFIFRMHNQLLDIFAAFNEYSGIMVFWILAHLFYSITTTAYHIFLLLASSNMSFYQYQFVCISQLQQESLLLLIALSCGKAAREANATRQIISKIYGQSEEIKYLMDKFLIKSIKHQIKFSALGFFNVEESIIFKILSSVTTYLVILIQFKQLEFEEEETLNN